MCLSARRELAVIGQAEPGVARGTSFSIKRYGEDEAYRRACELRWTKMREIYGDRYDVERYEDLVARKSEVDARAEERRAREG